MSGKETDARIIIEKLLREADWNLPGYVEEEEINVKTETKNEFGRADYVLNDSNNKHLCIFEAKNTLKSPLSGKEQAREYANALKCRFIILVKSLCMAIRSF